VTSKMTTGFLICAAALIPSAILRSQPLPADAGHEAVRAEERERDTREKISEVAAALGIEAGSVVADIGTGYGYYAVRMSPIVGAAGRIVAQEIDRPLVERLRARIRDEKLTNVEPVLGKPGDPALPPATFDAVLIADVYHEIDRPARFLELVRSALKPGGRLMIIDYLKPEMRKQSREMQRKQHNIAPEFVEADMKSAGYTVREVRDPYAPGFDNIPTYWVVGVKR
jgi:ubiquinone/menaquinone biosynthesis C-methylase UbiE